MAMSAEQRSTFAALHRPYEWNILEWDFQKKRKRSAIATSRYFPVVLGSFRVVPERPDKFRLDITVDMQKNWTGIFNGFSFILSVHYFEHVWTLYFDVDIINYFDTKCISIDTKLITADIQLIFMLKWKLDIYNYMYNS